MDLHTLSPNALAFIAALIGLALGFASGVLLFSRRSHALKIELAVAREKNARILELDHQLNEKSIRLDELLLERASLHTQIVEQRKAMDEKLALLQQAEVQLSARFENLANRILEEKAHTFAERNKTQLDGLLMPFRQQLGEFKQRVDEIHVDDARDRASLRQEIKHLQEQTRQINEDAVNLTRALKGDKKVQGTWGEMILERVLERSGLRKGVEYDIQGGYRDAEQRLYKPDVIVYLPEKKDIIIDSKVSLLAYERYASLDEGPERDAALREHIQAVRKHVKTLSDKNYSALMGLRSLDFVLMFLPIEAAFLLAFQHDDALFDDAFAENIVIVTPTTLLATLRTVENIWRYERQNANAQLIAEKAGAVYDKLRGFLEEMEKLGQQIGGLHKTYDDAMNKLSRGRGNLVRQAESFAELGVKMGKSLPKATLERAGLEEP
jgi:DNA recombination protein RmuC